MIRVYFVRHAQPEHDWEDDRTRPLTSEGKEDAKQVLDFFKDKSIDKFYSSPYRRSVDTIIETAQHFGKEIIMDERLREREKGPDGNTHGMFQKRWDNLNYHEEGGESITMVQKRNIKALKEFISEINISNNADKDIGIVIGTHGTALSSILNYYDSNYNCDSFLRIIDRMPYIIELDFENEILVNTAEHMQVYKEFKGKERADKPKNGLEVKFYDKVEDEKLEFAVIIAKTQGKWVFCKHKERNTYEFPGGHREEGENILHTARRELQEETGAIEFEITPICIYSVVGTTRTGEYLQEETFGMLYFANIESFEKELHYEIEKLLITDTLPEEWTYPFIQPKLFAKAKEFGYL